MVEWITAKQLAQELEVSDRTVRNWAVRGEIPATRVGRQWRLRRDEIEAWLSGNRISQQWNFQWSPASGSAVSVASAAKPGDGGKLSREIERLLEKRRRNAGSVR